MDVITSSRVWRRVEYFSYERVFNLFVFSKRSATKSHQLDWKRSIDFRIGRFSMEMIKKNVRSLPEKTTRMYPEPRPAPRVCRWLRRGMCLLGPPGSWAKWRRANSVRCPCIWRRSNRWCHNRWMRRSRALHHWKPANRERMHWIRLAVIGVYLSSRRTWRRLVNSNLQFAKLLQLASDSWKQLLHATSAGNFWKKLLQPSHTGLCRPLLPINNRLLPISLIWKRFYSNIIRKLVRIE